MDLETIKKKHETVMQQLSDPELLSDREKLENLLKKKDYFEKIIEKNREIEDVSQRIEENREILSAEKDPELLSLAESELQTLIEREKNLEKELSVLEKARCSDTADPLPPEERQKEKEAKSIIMEIRAGTGGEEAALFAGDLLNMYSKYATSRDWKQKILDSHPTELGGIKEITFELRGDDVFSKMKYEGGVHRVQRIPKTEKSGRVHTSTASVAVLPKPKKAEIKISPNDLKIDTYKASGAGGQYVNKRMTAIRITHLPTGTVVTSQTERNLQQNKENAMSILEARILEKKQISEEDKISGKRRTQIGQAKRAEKIRTYNFPQDRLTDHRIKKSFHNLEGIMAGKLDPIVETLDKKI